MGQQNGTECAHTQSNSYLSLDTDKPFVSLQSIALSASELGDLIDVIAGGQASKSIYHDPNKGRAG